MSGGFLSFEDGIVTVDGTELPGLLVQLSVSGQVKFDEAKTDGESGKKKTPMGYEDATVNIDLELVTDGPEVEDGTDCYDKLQTINRIFKDVGPKAAPKILSVVNRHLRARDVRQVVFSGLSSRESNQDDIILAALTFAEHVPPVTTAERKVVGAALKDQKKQAEEKTGSAPAAKPKETVISIDANATG